MYKMDFNINFHYNCIHSFNNVILLFNVISCNIAHNIIHFIQDKSLFSLTIVGLYNLQLGTAIIVNISNLIHPNNCAYKSEMQN